MSGRTRRPLASLPRSVFFGPTAALSPPSAAAEPVFVSVEEAFPEPVVVAIMILMAEPSKEELREHEEPESLPVRDLPETEYVRHQPVPEPLEGIAENEGKQHGNNDPEKNETEDAEDLVSRPPSSCAFWPLFHDRYLLSLLGFEFLERIPDLCDGAGFPSQKSPEGHPPFL